MITESDLARSDDRTLRIYDAGAGDLAVVWHHGTPNLDTPPAPRCCPSALSAR